MDPKIREILARPFAAELLKQRKGANGKTFTYIEIQHYIDRLNEAFQGAWSWEVVRRDIIDDQVIVEGRLSAGGVAKTGIGGSSVTRRRDDGRPVSLADDVKKSESDALKRATRLLGVAGMLYTGDEEEVPAQPPSPLRKAVAVPPPPKAPMPDNARITARQLNALRAIAKHQGFTDTEFRSYCVENHGAQPEYLSRAAASQLIESLGSRPNGHDHDAAVGS